MLGLGLGFNANIFCLSLGLDPNDLVLDLQPKALALALRSNFIHLGLEIQFLGLAANGLGQVALVFALPARVLVLALYLVALLTSLSQTP